MTKFTPKHIAWFIPLAYLLHLADEYFSGEGFHNWFSGVFGVSLSLSDFILINTIGLTIMFTIAILYSKQLVSDIFLALPGTLFFINGLVHILASAFTFSYSPGLLSSVIIYLPLGYIIFKKIFPLIPQQKRLFIFAVGIIIQIVVAVIALNI